MINYRSAAAPCGINMRHLVYKLRSDEYDRYKTHLLELDTDSRYTRFGFVISDAVIEKLCDKFKSNPAEHVIFVIEDESLNVVAAGHIALENQETEFAFSVLKQYHKQGMGSSLMKRTIEWCQNRNIKGGCMVCLSTNVAIKRLAAKHGVLINEGGETLANIVIPDPTPSSIIHEVIDSSLAGVDHLNKLHRNFVKSICK